MAKICDFDRILKTEWNLQHFTRKCRIKNWMTLKEMSKCVFVESRTFKCQGERNDHILHYEQVFGNVSQRRKSKCCTV